MKGTFGGKLGAGRHLQERCTTLLQLGPMPRLKSLMSSEIAATSHSCRCGTIISGASVRYVASGSMKQKERMRWIYSGCICLRVLLNCNRLFRGVVLCTAQRVDVDALIAIEVTINVAEAVT